VASLSVEPSSLRWEAFSKAFEDLSLAMEASSIAFADFSLGLVQASSNPLGVSPMAIASSRGVANHPVDGRAGDRLFEYDSRGGG